jgi:pimeloyl-ACP methyl ester carboxylesterase
MAEVRTGSFGSWDGARLGYREVGTGRTVVLLHGFFSNANFHWIAPGHAERLAAAGYRVVLPDLRGHGLSAGPRGPAAFPADVLVDDTLALIDHLEVDDFDLGGYSLGGRTALRAMIRGARPARAVIAGMGLASVVEPGRRDSRYRMVLNNLGTFEEGSSEWRAEQHLRRVEGDPDALLLVLDTSLPTTAEEIVTVTVPTLVLVGEDDHAHQSAEQLAELLPAASFERVAGTHTKAIRRGEIGAAIAAYLGPAPGRGEVGATSLEGVRPPFRYR